MKRLRLSPQLDVPIDLVTEKLAWIGVTGSGRYANNLGHLRTLGAVTYPHAGFVRAAEIMFIGGV